MYTVPWYKPKWIHKSNTLSICLHLYINYWWEYIFLYRLLIISRYALCKFTVRLKYRFGCVGFTDINQKSGTGISRREPNVRVVRGWLPTPESSSYLLSNNNAFKKKKNVFSANAFISNLRTTTLLWTYNLVSVLDRIFTLAEIHNLVSKTAGFRVNFITNINLSFCTKSIFIGV